MTDKSRISIPAPTIPKQSPRIEWVSFMAAHPHLFPAPSLAVWLELVKAAGVPFVPAEQVGEVAVEAMIRFDEGRPEDGSEFQTLRRVNESCPPGNMARWDCCASFMVKGMMGRPTNCGVESVLMSMLTPDDPRAFDILYEFPQERVALWHRPWVQARYHEGFPVEYRIFVKDSQIQGIANYYVQRALPDNAQTQAEIAQIRQHAEAIIAACKSVGRFPWMTFPSYSKQGRSDREVHATLDFLITPEGEALFLEAGPASGAGAHPCAFMGREVEGVALALAPGIEV